MKQILLSIITKKAKNSKKILIDQAVFQLKKTDKMEETTKCPVCGDEVEQDSIIVYCKNCGFNIRKKENDPKPKSS